MEKRLEVQASVSCVLFAEFFHRVCGDHAVERPFHLRHTDEAVLVLVKPIKNFFAPPQFYRIRRSHVLRLFFAEVTSRVLDPDQHRVQLEGFAIRVLSLQQVFEVQVHIRVVAELFFQRTGKC